MASEKHPKRPWVLLNPGPVNVTPGVRRALMGPDICHREDEFFLLLRSVRRRLVDLFGLSRTHAAALFSGSGTTALEAMLSSFKGTGIKLLVLSNGVYGERMVSILELHGVPHRVLRAPLGHFPSPSEIDAVLRRDRSLGGIALVHHETSSGMLNPLDAVGRLAKKHGRFLVVDAISSLGAESIDFRRLPIDFLCGTSGKCLHGFPGVSFVFVAGKRRRLLEKRRRSTLSLDLLTTLELEEKDDTPFTPAVQIFYAFEQALKELAREGLMRRIRAYRRKSQLLEKGFRAMGLRFLLEPKDRSHVLTALWTPEGISYQRMHDLLKKKGFVIYAGQSALKGRIFRVSNLGDISETDIRRFLAEFKKVLKSPGGSLPAGQAGTRSL